MKKLVDLSRKHRFLIFEDRKFADIGNTVYQQYTQGIYKINQWSNIVNAHSVSGPGVVKGLKQAPNSNEKGCLLIAQMSSEDTLTTEDYVKSI
jgi:orotidine-5'-phosphate decarboxylase